MNFDGKQLQDEFNEAFGELIEVTGDNTEHFNINSLSPKMLWWLVKFAKHICMRCRNNSAFNNYMNRNFPNAKFREVTKVNRKGETYQGLSIEVDGVEVQLEEDLEN